MDTFSPTNPGRGGARALLPQCDAPRHASHGRCQPAHARETREGKVVASRPLPMRASRRLASARAAPLARRAFRRGPAASLLGRGRDAARLVRDARPRPGHLPVHRLGPRARASATTATSATSTARSRTSSTASFSGSAARTSTASACSTSSSPGVTFSLVGACLPGLRSRRAPELVERVAWGLAGVGRPERPVPPLRLLGSRPARELLRLVPPARPGAPARASARGRAAARRLRLLALVGAPQRRALVRQAHVRALHASRSSPPRRSTTSLAGAAQASALPPSPSAAAVAALSQLAVLAPAPATRSRTCASSSSTCPRCTGSSGRARRADIFSNPWDATQADLRVHGGRRPPRRSCSSREMPRRAIAVGAPARCARWSASSSRPRASPTTSTRSPRECTCSGSSSPPGSPSARASRSGASPLVRLVPRRLARRRRAARRDVDGGLAAHPRHLAALGRRARRRTARRASTSRASPSRTSSPTSCARRPRTCARTHAPDDRVQTYGMDPYVLFLARAPLGDAVHLRVRPRRRRGARGLDRGPPRRRAGGAHPRPPRRARGRPPRAAASAAPRRPSSSSTARPSMTEKDAWEDFEGHCPAASGLGRTSTTVEAARFGHDHVWLRRRYCASPSRASPTTAPPEGALS